MKLIPTSEIAFQPWNCVILGIDAGERWGAYLSEGFSWHAGEGRSIERVVGCAWKAAMNARVPLVIVREKWSPYGKWSHTAKMGLAAHWGWWDHELRKLPRMRPMIKIVQVLPQTWKRAFGLPSRSGAEQYWPIANARAGLEFPTHDVAAAYLMAEWGSYAPEVGRLPGVRRRQC